MDDNLTAARFEMAKALCRHCTSVKENFMVITLFLADYLMSVTGEDETEAIKLIWNVLIPGTLEGFKMRKGALKEGAPAVILKMNGNKQGS